MARRKNRSRAPQTQAPRTRTELQTQRQSQSQHQPQTRVPQVYHGQNRLLNDLERQYDGESPFDRARNQFDNANFIETINSTTKSLDELVNKQVALLYLRARTHGKLGQYDDGLLDTQRIEEIAPHQALGYLAAGELYSMQGYQARAIHMYDKGLAAVTDGHREILERRREQAIALREKGVDIMGRIPYEILSKIVLLLPARERLTLMNVSKALQNRIVGMSECWSNIALDGRKEIQISDLRALHFILHHITSFRVEKLKDHALCSILFDQILHGKNLGIQKFDVHGCDVAEDALLSKAVFRTGGSLKEISIDIARKAEFSFKSLFGKCRKLESLTFICRIYPQAELAFGVSPNVALPSLTSLTSDIPSPVMKPHDVEKLLMFCPNLRSLAITHCVLMSVVTIVEYCTNLESLWFNVPRMRHDFDNTSHPEVKGLRNLATSFEDSVMLFFDEYCHTLENLFLEIPSGQCYHEIDWNELETMPILPEVRSLTFFNQLDEPGIGLSTIIPKLPALERIAFVASHFEQNETFEQLRNLGPLQHLEFTNITHVHYDFMRSFFEDQRDEASVQSVKLQSCNFVHDGFLQTLASTTSLQRIDINYTQNVSIRGMNNFCESLKDHPAIEFIALSNIKVVTDEALEYLSRIKGLKRLELAGLPNCTSRATELFDKSKVELVWTDRPLPIPGFNPFESLWVGASDDEGDWNDSDGPYMRQIAVRDGWNGYEDGSSWTEWDF
ncbi:hypothetical protein BJV82DRAFT_664625 [Fennellomyces sp. T-0311]|nr:hypothetical protein BJV82DRAFT_664625 [Fennellomyces sp. T-0311]